MGLGVGLFFLSMALFGFSIINSIQKHDRKKQTLMVLIYINGLVSITHHFFLRDSSSIIIVIFILLISMVLFGIVDKVETVFCSEFVFSRGAFNTL
ncbi:hypothetical protein [Alteribacter aurantiacus]|uniref:hypothetical protein n=1 Tax=Alteribacter aurantiacus TaxID=254410 RepID=UPI00047E6175|nr:hypothetical protein [Alteribacter aurantiacus]